MRPGQHSEGGKVRHGQHVAGATHLFAAEAPVSRKYVLKDAVRRIHGEKRGGKRDPVSGRLGEQSCLDRTHPHDAVSVDKTDADDLQLLLVNLSAYLRQPLPSVG